MSRIVVRIAGQHAYPPAKCILDAMPMGMELELTHEVTNAYDSNAVQVYADMTKWPANAVPALDAALAKVYNDLYSASELCSNGLTMIGYLASSANKRTNKGGPGNLDALAMSQSSDWGFLGLSTTFTRTLDAAPAVAIEEKESK